MSVMQIEVDADDMLGRQFSELEKKNLDFAIVQASNKTAFEVRESWKRAAVKMFDRPTPLTVNAALFRKATKQKLYAEIFIRDDVSKGTPPAQYLRRPRARRAAATGSCAPGRSRHCRTG